MFCNNPSCNHKTFNEIFDFVSKHAKKTKRLNDYILNLSSNMSSIKVQNTIRKNKIKIEKSTNYTF